jgi:hypothetical protein
MAKVISIFIICVLVSSSGFGQSNISPQQVAQKQVQIFKDSIGLNAAKVQQIYTINVNINYAKARA